jgi:quercetin dioxygenase-like cupin family protein
MTIKVTLAAAAVFACFALPAGAADKTGTMTSPDEMKCKEFAPGTGVDLCVLWGNRDKGEYAMMVRIPAGFAAPIHAHTGDYHGINVAGVWRHSFDGGEERDLPPGSYVFQPGSGFHGDACVGPEDCILFIHQHTKGDFIPKPE